VADDEDRAAVLHAVAAAHGRVVLLKEASAAFGALRGVDAAVLDATCLDGGAIEVLEALQRESGAVPAVVLCSPRDRFTQRQARDRGAALLLEPWRREDVDAFLTEARRKHPQRLAQMVERFGDAYDLSRREIELLHNLFVEGVAPTSLPGRMHVTRHTVATWRRRIRAKCGTASFGQVVPLLLLYALDSRSLALADCGDRAGA
jgi:DNA-binding NarL/FixJ family response regulator